MGDGPVAFHGKNQGEDDEERTDNDLCVGPPAGGSCHDDANLVFHDKGKRADGDEEHETHREEEHFIVLSRVAEPCSNSKEADGGKKLVSRAEESPDLGKSAHAEGNAEDNGDDGRKIRIYHEFAEPVLDIFRIFARFEPEFLEHEACQPGGGIKRSQAESGVSKDKKGVHNVFQSFKSRNGSDHGGDPAGKDICRAMGMARYTGIADCAESDDGEYAFQEHTAISDRLCVRFFIKLFGRRPRRNKGMEAGNGAACNGSEQNREEELRSVCVVDGEARKSGEDLFINGRMSADDADDGDDEHCVEKERTEVVTRLEKDPDRSDRSDGDINADKDHPCIHGEIERMEIHADGHAQNDCPNAEDGRNDHRRVAAVYGKTENDSDEDEHDGNHGDRCFCRAGSHVENAVLISRAEGGSHDSGKSGHYKDQCEV